VARIVGAASELQIGGVFEDGVRLGGLEG